MSETLRYSAPAISEWLLVLHLGMPGGKLVIDSEGLRFTMLADAFGEEPEPCSLAGRVAPGRHFEGAIL